ETRVADRIDQLQALVQRLDHHAGLGLDQQRDVLAVAELAQALADGIDQYLARIERRVAHVLRTPKAAAESHEVHAEVPRHADAALDEIDAPLAAGDIHGHERRLVRALRVEEVGRGRNAGRHDAGGIDAPL